MSDINRGDTIRMVEQAIGDMRDSQNRTGWMRGPCPFCLLREGKKDKKWSFGFNKFTLRYSCFRCGTYGTLPGEPMDMGMAPPPKPIETIEPPEGFVPMYDEGSEHSETLYPAFDYLLNKRGLTYDIIEWARIGMCVTGRFRNRVVIPVFDESGYHWIGFVARALWKGATRPYLNSEGTWRSSLIYNGGALEIETTVPALIVEGAFDTYPFWPDSGAVFGKPSPAQIEMMMNAKRPVVLVPDGDAWREGWALCMKMRMMTGDFSKYGVLRLPPTKDPDEMCRDSIRQAAQESLLSIEAVSV